MPDDPKSFGDFVAAFGGLALDEDMTMVLLRWPSGGTRSYLKLKTAVWKLADMPFVTDDESRVPSKLQASLARVKIGILGLGSLGSKIAVSLARSGARRFVFVDGDVMQSENVCRHQGTYRDVGIMKVKVGKELVREVFATEPDIKTYPLDLGAPTNPDLHAALVADLADCDVIVDATGNPQAFGIAAGLASDHKKVLVWAEVFAAGLGGLVASAHPDRDPCPRCVRAGFVVEAASWPPAPYSRTMAAYGTGEDEALIATDADVGMIAACTAHRVTNLVAGEPCVLPSVMLLGFRPGWIFESPMQSVTIRVRSDDSSCDRCWKEAVEPDLWAAAAAEKLLSGDANAHDPSHG